MTKINEVEFPIVKFLLIIQGRMSGWPFSLFVPFFFIMFTMKELDEIHLLF